MSFFASGLGVGTSSFFGISREPEKPSHTPDIGRDSSLFSKQSTETSSTFQFVSQHDQHGHSEDNMDKSNHQEVLSNDGEYSEDMEVEEYTDGPPSRDDDPESGVENQSDDDSRERLMNPLAKIAESDEDTMRLPSSPMPPMELNRKPEGPSKRHLEVSAERPYTEEGASNKRSKMSAPKLVKPSLKVKCSPIRLNKPSEITPPKDLQKKLLPANPQHHIQTQSQDETSIAHPLLTPENKTSGTKRFTFSEPHQMKSAARTEKKSSTAFSPTAARSPILITPRDSSALFDIDENFSYDDGDSAASSSTQEYLSRVGNLLEAGKVQLSDAVERLDVAAMDISKQKYRLHEHDCVLSSTLKMTVALKKVESLRARLAELEWE